MDMMNLDIHTILLVAFVLIVLLLIAQENSDSLESFYGGLWPYYGYGTYGYGWPYYGYGYGYGYNRWYRPWSSWYWW